MKTKLKLIEISCILVVLCGCSINRYFNQFDDLYVTTKGSGSYCKYNGTTYRINVVDNRDAFVGKWLDSAKFQIAKTNDYATKKNMLRPFFVQNITNTLKEIGLNEDSLSENTINTEIQYIDEEIHGFVWFRSEAYVGIKMNISIGEKFDEKTFSYIVRDTDTDFVFPWYYSFQEIGVKQIGVGIDRFDNDLKKYICYYWRSK